MQLISKTQAVINEEVANAILVKQGDRVRYVTIH
jgi:arginine N-succinyltransferase